LSPISASGFFCDDVRTEVNGLHTIVGIYPDKVALPNIPGLFQILWLYIRVHLDPELDPGSMKVFLTLPNGNEIHVSDVDPDMIAEVQKNARDEASPFAGVLLRFRFGDFQIQQPGRLTVILRTEHQGDLVAATLFTEIMAADPSAEAN
jgi:hypothetical protein